MLCPLLSLDVRGNCLRLTPAGRDGDDLAEVDVYGKLPEPHDARQLFPGGSIDWVEEGHVGCQAVEYGSGTEHRDLAGLKRIATDRLGLGRRPAFNEACIDSNVQLPGYKVVHCEREWAHRLNRRARAGDTNGRRQRHGLSLLYLREIRISGDNCRLDVSRQPGQGDFCDSGRSEEYQAAGRGVVVDLSVDCLRRDRELRPGNSQQPGAASGHWKTLQP